MEKKSFTLQLPLFPEIEPPTPTINTEAEDG
jgi:hypothetical protein